VRKADEYFDSQTYDLAEIEYINALRINSEDSHALARLGIIYLNEGRPRQAYTLLSSAIKAKPDNMEAQKYLAQVEIEAGKFAEARAALNLFLDHEPTDPDAPLLLVDSSRSRTAVEEARKRLLALPDPAPRGAPVLVALGTIDLHEHKFDEAASEFSQALAIDPKSADAKAASGYLAWAKNDRASADASFAAAAALSAPYSRRQLQYAEFEVRIGKIDAAKKQLEATTLKAPRYLSAWVMLSQIAGQQKNYDEGLEDVAKVLAIDAENPGALLQKSRLQLAKGDTKDAVSGLEVASKDYPKSVQVDFELAKAYLATGDISKAELSLKRVLGAMPKLLEAEMMLADVEVKKGDGPTAIAILKKILHDHPDAGAAQLLLGQAYRSVGDLNDAIATFEKLAAAYPKDIRAPIQLGEVYLDQRDTEKAREEFEKARTINPDYDPALEHLIDLDLMTKNFEEAHRRVNGQIASHPADANAELILARIYLSQRDAAGAETALKRAIELQPVGTRAYALLAGLYLSTNRQNEALADVKADIVAHPKDMQAMMLQGAIQERLKDYAGELATYEKILSIDPNSVAALNNVAFLYGEHLGNLDKALDAAEQAEKLQPDEPHIGDTLGWILYRRHQYARALALLTDSANRQPSDPEVQFHLGMVEYMLGQEEPARETLKHAVDMAPQFPDRDEAVRRLAILNPGPGKAGEAALEKEASGQKDDPVVLNRLAALYEAEGSTDKAISTDEDALKASPDDASVLARLARLYLEKKDTAKAIEIGKAARKLAPDDAQLAHTLGNAAYQSGDYPWSLSLLQEAAQKLPDDPEVHFDLGSSYYSEGNVADAEAQMKSALQSSGFTRPAEAKQFVQMLDLTSQPTRSAADRTAIQQYLDAHPDAPVALMASAAVHEDSGDPAAAKKEYEKVLTLLPDFVPAKRNLAIIYSKSGEDDKAGFDLAVKARAALPDDSALEQALGVIDYRRADYLSAKNLLTDVLAQRPNDPELNFYVGMTALNLKDAASAKKELQKALDFKLDEPHASEAKRALATLK
jgi:putative PEP-CTERM system TPR-repeat lipoprotein